jgi:hypothetical protein
LFPAPWELKRTPSFEIESDGVNRSVFLVEALLNSIGQVKSCLLSDKGVAPPGLSPFAQPIEIEVNA